MKHVRTALYYATWPLEWAVRVLAGAVRFTRMLVIASNPLFLALWLASRKETRHDPTRH